MFNDTDPAVILISTLRRSPDDFLLNDLRGLYPKLESEELISEKIAFEWVVLMITTTLYSARKIAQFYLHNNS